MEYQYEALANELWMIESFMHATYSEHTKPICESTSILPVRVYKVLLGSLSLMWPLRSVIKDVSDLEITFHGFEALQWFFQRYMQNTINNLFAFNVITVEYETLTRLSFGFLSYIGVLIFMNITSDNELPTCFRSKICYNRSQRTHPYSIWNISLIKQSFILRKMPSNSTQFDVAH